MTQGKRSCAAERTATLVSFSKSGLSPDIRQVGLSPWQERGEAQVLKAELGTPELPASYAKPGRARCPIAFCLMTSDPGLPAKIHRSNRPRNRTGISDRIGPMYSLKLTQCRNEIDWRPIQRSCGRGPDRPFCKEPCIAIKQLEPETHSPYGALGWDRMINARGRCALDASLLRLRRQRCPRYLKESLPVGQMITKLERLYDESGRMRIF